MPNMASLKADLKARGLPQTGEKGDLENRLRLYELGEKFQLDGQNPLKMKAGEFKKALAKRGLPCDLSIESRDQLNARLIDALKKEAATDAPAGGGGGGGGAAAGGGGADDAEAAAELAVEVAKQVLALGEAGDYEGVLSLAGGSRVSRSSPFAVLRKAYLNLSRLIHPDKLSRTFDGATRAFQELVLAFEGLTAPEPVKGPAKKAAKNTISRSNDRCHRTRLFCPRCSAEWAMKDSGLPDYEYTLMMQGLKTYCCALCLCDFGCMTAIHRCPICNRKGLEYHPNDYHRIVKCTKCNKEFGFWLYHIPARIEDDLRAELKAEQERRLKAREAKAARLARLQRKQPQLSAAAQMKQAEALFVRNLVDTCPRCGYEPPRGVTYDELQEHLDGCTDKGAHSAHAKAVANASAKVEAKEAREDAQSEAQNLASWRFLGGSTESMWLLTDGQLKKQCEESGIDASGETREQMLAALARHRGAGSNLITDASGASASADGGPPPKRAKGGFTLDSLPSNLHSMSLAQLKAVCAAHGVVAVGESVDEVIAHLEKEALRDGDAPLRLE